MSSIKTFAVACSALLAAGAPLAKAQHGHGEEHGKPVEFKMPTTYKDAVKEIDYRLHAIDELMQSKHLDQVHAQADVIQKIGKVIGQLALKPDSGVPKDAVKEVNLAAKDIAAKFDAIDKAGDAGDLAGTRKVYDEMVQIAETLRKYVPKEYACPMKCEGNQTYDKPGKCPKCGMNLVEVKGSDRGPHGGPLVSSGDGMRQVEATLSAQGELRVYLYGTNLKSVSAESATAEGKVWKQGSSEAAGKNVTLSAEPGKAFLTGQVDASIKPPLNLKLNVDFKDGQKPQAFEFEFDEPTKPSSENPHGEGHDMGHGSDEHKGHKP